jgi:hypothetical protein
VSRGNIFITNKCKHSQRSVTYIERDYPVRGHSHNLHSPSPISLTGHGTVARLWDGSPVFNPRQGPGLLSLPAHRLQDPPRLLYNRYRKPEAAHSSPSTWSYTSIQSYAFTVWCLRARTTLRFKLLFRLCSVAYSYLDLILTPRNLWTGICQDSLKEGSALQRTPPAQDNATHTWVYISALNGIPTLHPSVGALPVTRPLLSPIFIFVSKFTLSLMAMLRQLVARRLPAVAAPVRYQVTSCGICREQIGIGVGFLRVLWFPCQSSFHRLLQTHHHL